jgi:hypothetical protein
MHSGAVCARSNRVGGTLHYLVNTLPASQDGVAWPISEMPCDDPKRHRPTASAPVGAGNLVTSGDLGMFTG